MANAAVSKECVICMSEEDEDTKLMSLPCGEHFVCKTTSACLEGFFRDAMAEEKAYPPRCCEGPLSIEDYEEILPWDFQWEYLLKIREYSVAPKTRLYCGNKSCGQFLYSENYETFKEHTVAICNACKHLTCTKCKRSLFDITPLAGCTNKLAEGDDAATCTKVPRKRCTHCTRLLSDFIEEHKCEIPEHDLKFELAAQKYAYQTCPNCNSTVELAEACNHMNCACGQQFCYVCGRSWSIRWNRCIHGCPQYGKPNYDAEGYNIDGYHRDTGLNRDGLRLAEVEAMEERESDDESDEEENDVQRLRTQIPGIGDDLIETLLALPIEEREMAVAQAWFHADARGEMQLGAPADQAAHGNGWDVEDGGEDEGWGAIPEDWTTGASIDQDDPFAIEMEAINLEMARRQALIDDRNADPAPDDPAEFIDGLAAIDAEIARRQAILDALINERNGQSAPAQANEPAEQLAAHAAANARRNAFVNTMINDMNVQVALAQANEPANERLAPPQARRMSVAGLPMAAGAEDGAATDAHSAQGVANPTEEDASLEDEML